MRKPPQGFAIQLCGELKGSKGGHLNQDKSTTALNSRIRRLQSSSGAHAVIEQGGEDGAIAAALEFIPLAAGETLEVR
jgi:hypothetical protein